jgi:hypothetical protein
MTVSQRHTMFLALLVATALVVLNIFAVTSGTADNVYTDVIEWVKNTLLLPPID